MMSRKHYTALAKILADTRITGPDVLGGHFRDDVAREVLDDAGLPENGS